MNSTVLKHPTFSSACVDRFRRVLGYGFPRLGNAGQALIRGLLPREILCELHPGISVRLDLDDETQRSTWWRGLRFEEPTAAILADDFAPGATAFFDIGSNYGFFSWLIASRYPEMPVYAFEANRKTFERFMAIRNNNALPSVQCWNMGLSDGPGRLTLHRGGADSGHSTFADHPGLDPQSVESVEVDSFDNWRMARGIKLPENPSWVAKIDVEGFEPRVLRGMSESLQAKAFTGLVVEINSFTLALTKTHPGEITTILSDFGYEEVSGLPLGADGNAFFRPTGRF